MPQSKASKPQEEPSVSFHYLARYAKADQGKRTYVGFTPASFDALADTIALLPDLDLDDRSVSTRVRLRQMAPLGTPERIDSRTMFGTFEGAYSGHSYRNTHVGAIPAASISLRTFYYLLYLSNSGRIYIGAQYLGHSGGYDALQKTIKEFLGDPESIESRSVRVGGSYYANAQPKEVRVTYARTAKKISAPNSISDNGMIAFRKQSKNDDFEGIVRDRLLLTAGQSTAAVKRAVAGLTNDSDVVTLDEDAVRDCTILADFKGRRRTIYMLEAGITASKIPLDVGLTADGHPIRDQCKAEMRDLLATHVISKLENA